MLTNLKFFNSYRCFFVAVALLIATLILINVYFLFSRDGQDDFSVFATAQIVFMVITGGLIVLQDRSVRRSRLRHEEDNMALRRRLDALEAAAEGIGIIDRRGDFVYMNKALINLHGIAEKDIDDYIGHSWNKLYAKKGAGDVEQYVMPKIEQSGFWHGEMPLIRTDGLAIMLEVSISRTDDGGLVITARDVSDQHKATQEKEDLEEQFFQAQKMEAIGRLAGGIAHDFNNILAAMNGYAEFLSEDLSPDTEQHEFSLKILQAGRQAKDLVDQLLAFSRQKQSARNVLNVLDPVKETVSILSSSLPKSIELHFNPMTEHAPIDGNETQISQVIMNLCVNAADAMAGERGVLNVALSIVNAGDVQFPQMLADDLPDAKENPQIAIEDVSENTARLYLNTLARDRRYVKIRVDDNGEGMSRVIMEHIFEPFFTTKEVNKGTGLGLSTVHGVVVGHQGALVLESTIGKGTAFDIYLPLIDDESITASLASQDDDDDAANEQKSGRILLVEDEEYVRDMVLKALNRLGYQVDVCVNGLEALATLKADSSYRLVITDQNMPKMTGVELVTQAQLVAPNMPFIILSGYAQERLNDLMADLPMIKAALRKPVSKKKLAEKVDYVISRAA